MNKKILVAVVLFAILMLIILSTAQDSEFENVSSEDLAAMQEVLGALNTSTALPENETDAMLNETIEEFIKMFEDLSSLLPSETAGNNTTHFEMGRGNIFIKAFMILTLVFGVGISLLMLRKIDARERQFKSGGQAR